VIRVVIQARIGVRRFYPEIVVVRLGHITGIEKGNPELVVRDVRFREMFDVSVVQ
jgi:hypothetical protein